MTSLVEQFETELASMIERHGVKLTDNQIITGLERALDEALVFAGDTPATKVRADLVDALKRVVTFFSPPGEDSMERFERLADEFYRETRVMAPGKDSAAGFGGPEPEERRVIWDGWVAARVAHARDLIANS